MSLGLFAAYLSERENAHLIEHDWGFAVYKLAKDHIYLQDIYVTPDKRKEGLGVELMNQVAAAGRKAGHKYMLGSVVPSTPFASNMLTIMSNLGFRLHSSENNIVYLIKEI